MSDEASETNGTTNGAAATTNGAAAPSPRGKAPRPQDMPKRRRAARAPRVKAAPVADVPELDELKGDDHEGAELVDGGEALPEPIGVPFEPAAGAGSQRVTRVRWSATIHVNLWAELVVYCEAHHYPISTVIEHALARFLLIRGIQVPGVFDDPELRALLAIAPAGASPQR